MQLAHLHVSLRLRLKMKGLDLGDRAIELTGLLGGHTMRLHGMTSLMRNLGVQNACQEAVDLCEVGTCRCDPLDIVVPSRMNIVFREQNNDRKTHCLLWLLILHG